MRMEKSKKSRFFFRFCFAQETGQGGDRGRFFVSSPEETKNRPLPRSLDFFYLGPECDPPVSIHIIKSDNVG
jgi:hypothetical protein